MVKAESCHNCVYSRWDRNQAMWTMSVGVALRPTCANQPDFPGRMKECPLGRVCNNFRARPPTPKGETVKTISLGDGFYAYVDAADFDWLNQWTWHLCGLYAGRMEKGKVIFMHREILKPPKGMIVDHKNRNKLDNTRDNLRAFTRAQNACNRPKRRGSSSRFRGVAHRKKDDKYWAQVYYKGERLFLGNFTDEIEAARAHDHGAVELLGESAQPNFPDEWPPERRAQVYAQGDAARRGAKARARQTAAKKAPRKTPAARRTTKPTRATKKARAETQGRRGGKGQTRAKPVKPRATRDERRATKQAKKSGRRTHNAKRTTKSKRPKRKAT